MLRRTSHKAKRITEMGLDGSYPRRPFGVTVLIFIELLTLLVVVLIDLKLLNIIQLNRQALEVLLSQDRLSSLLVLGAEGINQSLNTPLQREFWITSISLVVISVRLLFILGLFWLRRWAWVLVMVQVGVIMVFDLYSYLNGVLPYLSMVTSVVMVFYLNQREVQLAFRHRKDRVEVSGV